jgi:hypothetical protein
MRLRSLAFGPLLALTFALILGPVGCAGSTTIEHVWRAPDWSGLFNHVAIFGVSKRAGVRRDFETKMAAAFANVGVKATPSFELFPDQDGELSDEDIARVLAERGIDAALVTRLVGVRTQEQYVDGTPYAVYGGIPMGFYGFYHGSWAVLYSPGYTVEFPIVTIETNLYDVASSELVWSGLSETFDPETVDEAIESYSQTMVTALVEAGLLTRTITPGAIESHN